jgi:hypothetical protein
LLSYLKIQLRNLVNVTGAAPRLKIHEEVKVNPPQINLPKGWTWDTEKAMIDEAAQSLSRKKNE